MRLLLVCSPGGHLQQMLMLREAWEDSERLWVTLPGPDIDFLLADEPRVLGFGPTNRSLLNLLRNLRFAVRTVRAFDPDAVLSTGAGLAVPFFIAGRLKRARCVYVESVTRTESLSLSGRMVYPLAHRFFVQWPAAARSRKRAEFTGRIL